MSVSSLELLPSPAAPDACAQSGLMTTADPQSVQCPVIEKVLTIVRAGRRSVGLAEFGSAWLERFHSSPALLFSTSSAVLKQDANRRAALVDAGMAERSLICFLKETISRNWWVRFSVQFAELRSTNAWRQGLAMRAACIRTPRPVALATFSQNGAYYEYLITEIISNATTLDRWLGLQGASITVTEDNTQRRFAALELGTQIRRLHQHRFDHRDLKASNILVSECEAGLQLWLIDLDGVWRWPILPKSRRIQNLARLWIGVARSQQVTAADALRFLKVYLGQDWRRSWKSFWLQIGRRAELKMASDQRRKRRAANAVAGTSGTG
jgi:hypothetical protein